MVAKTNFPYIPEGYLYPCVATCVFRCLCAFSERQNWCQMGGKHLYPRHVSHISGFVREPWTTDRPQSEMSSTSKTPKGTSICPRVVQIKTMDITTNASSLGPDYWWKCCHCQSQWIWHQNLLQVTGSPNDHHIPEDVTPGNTSPPEGAAIEQSRNLASLLIPLPVWPSNCNSWRCFPS